jgi:hypothetical protein
MGEKINIMAFGGENGMPSYKWRTHIKLIMAFRDLENGNWKKRLRRKQTNTEWTKLRRIRGRRRKEEGKVNRTSIIPHTPLVI